MRCTEKSARIELCLFYIHHINWRLPSVFVANAFANGILKECDAVRLLETNDIDKIKDRNNRRMCNVHLNAFIKIIEQSDWYCQFYESPLQDEQSESSL